MYNSRLQTINLNKFFVKKKIKKEKYKTELCKKMLDTGSCPYGYNCKYAHTKKELIKLEHNKSYKSVKCKNFHEKKFCPYGDRCKFAHNEANIADDKFDKIKNHILYKTEECVNWNNDFCCPYGNNCSFIHRPIWAIRITNKCKTLIYKK
jgi:hypothetical protein